MKKSDLTKHMATHNGNTFQCPQCEMTFTWQKQLKHHVSLTSYCIEFFSTKKTD